MSHPHRSQDTIIVLDFLTYRDMPTSNAELGTLHCRTRHNAPGGEWFVTMPRMPDAA
jgi:hypothetical protein